MGNGSPEIELAATAPATVRWCWQIITNEYPPQRGGVSDYTEQVALALAAEGDDVHVWCPACSGEQALASGVSVHRELGSITRADVRRVGELLDRYPAPRRILVQWVPTGYGYRAMNLPFCWWVWERASRHGDRVEIMLHEPFLDLRTGTIRQRAVALVHRLLTIILLRAATRVWMSIPAWEPCWRPYALGRRIPFQWLPIPSNVPVANHPRRAQELRHRYAPDGALIGHFGTYGTVTSVLEPILCALGNDPVPQTILLMGIGSQEYRDAFIRRQPQLSGRILATGALCAEDLSCHIAACDLMIQPYPDGVSSRRTSFMAGLNHGKVVITTAGAATEEIWAATGAAPMAPAGDTAGFADLARRYRDNAALRAQTAAAARRTYQDRFDVRHVIAKLRAAEEVRSFGSGNGAR